MKVNISEKEIDFDAELKPDAEDRADDDLEEEQEPVVVDLDDEAPEADEAPEVDEEDEPEGNEDQEEGGKKPEDEDEDDDDQSSYSKRVRARIQRERKLKEQEREARLRAEQEIEQLRAKLFEIEVDRDALSIDERIEAAKTKLKDARYESDVDAEADALAELQQLKARKSEIEANKQRKQQRQADENQSNEALDAWMERNKEWFNKPGYEVETAAALEANRKIAASGIPDTDPRFYVRLDKELRSRIKLPEPKRPRKEVAAVEDDAPVRGSKVTLNHADFKFMRALGLDPTNKIHLREYAQQKRQEARQ